ncbi:MAG TPA: flagellar biosynthesis anti-sigma factor FlgM [Pusillimonas sp.]|nr:flagellar biosynthesis anti-sigma factor FlgM [Pusillimonas sp.]MBC41933.1 flagellar biosynthesis anti-sigma factor FlgM [Pusillimonas sp.]HBT31458.1 flagellar biosynthesis anti-sigma factor FlgM [Pusillimonas sp.]HCN70219.1 flagellar biosynthesis anti-sigma factor FlgM [Pusillimonas sp.]
MKITPSIKNAAVTPATPSRQGPAQAAQNNSGGKTAVDLSPAARQLANLQNGENDIDMARVQQIKDALASGQLKINPERIADGLLASARELLNK